MCFTCLRSNLETRFVLDHFSFSFCSSLLEESLYYYFMSETHSLTTCLTSQSTGVWFRLRCGTDSGHMISMGSETDPEPVRRHVETLYLQTESMCWYGASEALISVVTASWYMNVSQAFVLGGKWVSMATQLVGGATEPTWTMLNKLSLVWTRHRVHILL